MTDINKGKIITDADISLPSIEDYNRNSLIPLARRDTVNQENVYYIEDPWISQATAKEDYIGFNSDKTIFGIKASKDSFLLSDLDINCGFVDGNTLYVDMDKCDVGTNSQAQDFFNQLISREGFYNYIEKLKVSQEFYAGFDGSQENFRELLDRYSTKDIVRNSIGNLMILNLMFTNSPQTPTYTIKLLKREDIETRQFQSLSLSDSSYHFEAFKPNFSDRLVSEYSAIDLVYFDKKTKCQVFKLKDYGVNIPGEDGKEWYYVLNAKGGISKSYREAALKAKEDIVSKIKEAEDIRICVSADVLNRSNKKYLDVYPVKFAKVKSFTESLIDDLKTTLNNWSSNSWHRYTGFNAYGQDSYGKDLAVVYVKVKVESKTGDDPCVRWINLNKYIISQMKEYKSIDTNYEDSIQEFLVDNHATKNFKPTFYKCEGITYVDNPWGSENDLYKENEKRLNFHKNILEKSGHITLVNDKKDNMYEWTVTLGDVTFLTPPSAIRMITQTHTERAPLLRAKGSMVKSIEKSDSQLEISLFFNESDGINGIEYHDGNFNETYYMNGLRALISQFKFTPLLPITNKYINETLGIFAVSLERLNIGTVPGFPKLIKATLLLNKMDYRIYMPEVPKPFYEDEANTKIINPYALCINYDVMRYYYQKPLKLGNEIYKKLKNKSYDFNSTEFLKATTYAGKTALMPCDFVDPNIKVYIANEDYLKKLLSIKKDAAAKAASGAEDNYAPDAIGEQLIGDLAALYPKLNKIINKYQSRYDGVSRALEAHQKEDKDTFTYFDANYGNNNGLFETTINVSKNSNSYELNKMIEKRNNDLKSYYYEYVWNPFDRELQELKNSLESLYGHKIIKNVYFNTIHNNVEIDLNIDYVLLQSDIKDLIDYAFKESVSSGLSSDDIENVLKNNKITIDLNQSWGTNYVGNIYEHPARKINHDLSFLKYCYSYSSTFIDPNGEAKAIKDVIDWDNVKSIKYDLIVSTDNPDMKGNKARVDSFSASMANNFARISLLDSDGTAPQYIGSQDVMVEWNIVTKDEELVSIFKSLTEYEAYCMRNYHTVLPCFPIRIDSEFTRMLGVYEVSIESVVVSTIPNQPGLYGINIRAASVDRTLRNREALKSLSNTDEYDNANGISGEVNNTTVTHSDMATQVSIRSFMDINNKLARAQVYPDLELPTIGELADKNFRFIRYKNAERDANDLFVDPDFYFYYPFLIKSEVIKNVIESQYGDESDSEVNLVTQDGSAAKMIFNSDYKRVEPLNKKAKETQQEAFNNAISNASANKIESGKKDRLLTSLAAMFGDDGKWDVSTRICTQFMEAWFVTGQFPDGNKINLTEEERNNIKAFYNEKVNVNVEVTNSDGSNESISKIKKLKNEIFSKAIDHAAAYDGLASLTETTESSVAEEFINILNAYCYDLKMGEGSGASYLLSNNTKKSFKHFINAARCAFVAPYEYSKTEENDWKGLDMDSFGTDSKKFIYGYYDSGNSIKRAEWTDDPKNYVISGLYNIKAHTKSELLEYLRQEDIDKLKNLDPNKRYVLDPYFLDKPNEIPEHMKRCAINRSYCIRAFCREVLWWLIRLYEENLFPNIAFDVMRKETINNGYAKKHASKIIKETFGEELADENTFEQIADYAKDNSSAFDSGKLFCAVILAVYGKPPNINNELFQLMVKRDYKGLNAKIETLSSPKYKNRDHVSPDDARLRRFLMALCGYGEINAPEYIGRKNEASAISKIKTNRATNIVIKAANNPRTYVHHSFYDMIRSDYRGRMLRAFPTFYCLFMDEGREIGLWKLHDNFYSINAINEIDIVKSRKIPADTCRLLLSNNFSTFTTEDEDSYLNYKGYTIGELWDNFWETDREKAVKEEKKRLAANRINRAKLQPGIRIHVRMGYGSDARELGCSFNGVIASVQPGAQCIEVVAQGNGIELTNPLMEDTDADEIQHLDTFSANKPEESGASPRTILNSILTTYGGATNKYVQGEYDKNQAFFNKGASGEESGVFDTLSDYLKSCWNESPYGIKSFGSREFRDIIPEGEVVQNIYEVSNLPFMDTDGTKLYGENDSLKDAPLISFEPRGKTFWDIMHICKSVAPDYVTGLRTFGLRDTIFFGKPHYYYAYDYMQVGETLVEKRKPFQQYHIYYSDSDIITNDIKPSSEKIRTVATGLFNSKSGLMTNNKDVGPMWVDKDIYSEYQKSMVVDTKINMESGALTKGGFNFNSGFSMLDGVVNTVIGTAQSVTTTVEDVLYTIPSAVMQSDLFNMNGDDSGEYSSHKKVAWAATANALKESVKEMYQGTMSVIGDPSVKPNDRLFISDAYNDISGQALVRDVVISLSMHTGFTSTISVDTISIVDDREEYGKASIWSEVFNIISQAVFLNSCIGNFSNVGNPIVTKAGKYLKDKFVSELAEEGIEKLFKASKYFNSVTNVTKNGKIIKALKYAGTGAKFIHKLFVISNPVMLGCEFFVALGNFATSQLYWPIKNSQVLVIFPLKKNGIAYTAGLEGSAGLCYGTPSYNKVGAIEKVYKLLSDNKEDHEFLAFAKDVLINDNTASAALKYNRDYATIQALSEGNVGDEINLESTIFKIASKNSFHRQENIYGLSLFPRAKINPQSEIDMRILDDALSGYVVDNIDTILRNERSKNRCLLRNHNKIQSHIEGSKILKLLHEKDNNAINLTMDIGNEKLSFKAMNMVEDGTSVVDVPFLSKDSIVVLDEICLKANESISSTNQKDNTSLNNLKEENHIVLTSALRINSKSKLNSSGYAFTLQGVGVFKDGLEDIINEIYNETKDQLDKTINNVNEINEISNKVSIKDNGETINFSENSLCDSKEYNDYDSVFNEEYINKFKGLNASTNNYKFSDLDSLKRCQESICLVSQRKFEERGSISNILPTGWIQSKYDVIQKTYLGGVTDGWLYARCHLIRYAFCGVNDDQRNLVTGTVFMNNSMLKYENMIRDHVEKYKNVKVLYSVKPHFEGDNMLCSYVELKALAVNDNYEIINEDKDGKLNLHVHCYNVQPGIEIDYSDGSSIEDITAVVKNNVIVQDTTTTNQTINREPLFVSKRGTNGEITIMVTPRTPLGG